MFDVIRKKLTRAIVLAAVFFLPPERKRIIERKLRGKEENRKLGLADWVLVSWGKSGRTWFRMMISRVYQVKFGLKGHQLIGFDNLHRKNRNIPKVFFTHGNYLADYTEHRDSKVDFYRKKVVLLVRDPRDIAVSQFFQWKFRMRPHKKMLNQYPEHGADLSTYDFVMNENQGMPRIIKWMNSWGADKENVADILVIRYEDLRKDPNAVMKQVMEFTGTSATDEQIQDAVDFAAYANMKKMEEKRVFRFSGGRMVAKDLNNPDSFKTRRAKVGGYRDYFDDEQVRTVDAMITDELNPLFGYKVDPEVVPAVDVGEVHDTGESGVAAAS